MLRFLHRYVLRHRQKHEHIPIGPFGPHTGITRCECGWVWSR